MTTPDQNEAREARDFPCCEDGEHVPAEIAGDLFTATLNRAQWHRVDEALIAHGRNDAVRGQIAVTKIAARPTPPELEREGDAASRVATPPEDVAAAIAYLTPIAESATVGLYGEMLRVALAALAAVPADGETEWAESLVNDGMHEFTVSGDCDGSNEKRWMRIPRRVIKAGPWLPIPESEEQ